jgi:O-succinylbenzoic acid--CoA ligase
LPQEAKSQLIEQMKPSHIISVEGQQRLPSGVSVESGDALVVATSGSTGVPKGVVLTHDAVLASARASSSALDVQIDDHWYSCLPLAHVGGLSVVTRSLLMGTQLTVASRFEPDEVERHSHTCTLISLVPTALQRIDPRKFRAILLGGSKPPTDRPKNVIATYGLTETGSGIVYDGRPLNGVDIKIADDGEILVRSPMNMRGYRDGSTSIDADGWLHTEDLGWISEDGVLSVQGRRGDVIVTGSEKVWPEVVEGAIALLFEPNQFAVIGLPDPEWGERVVVATTCADISLSEIRDLVLKTLPNYCVPKSIHIVESIPQTAIGKIRRVALRQQLSASN